MTSMESVAPKFQGVAVELVSKNSGSLCTVPMLWAEMNAHKEECVNVLVESAKDALGGCPVKHLTYQDDDGDMCTLKAPTLSDAMTFIQEVQGQPGWGYLRITVEKVEEKAESQPAEPAEAAPEPASKPEEPTHSSCVNEAAVLGWLNCLGHSLDLRSLIPKLAEAALRIIDREAEEPALYGLLDVLMAFRDGHKTAEDIPPMVPQIMEVLEDVPVKRLVSLFALAQNEAKQIVAEFRKEKHANAEAAQDSASVEEAIQKSMSVEEEAPKTLSVEEESTSVEEAYQKHPSVEEASQESTSVEGESHKSVLTKEAPQKTTSAEEGTGLNSENDDSNGHLELTIYIDSDLGIKEMVRVSASSTIWNVKEQLASLDVTGETTPESFDLKWLGPDNVPLPDAESVLGGSNMLELCV
mmetsp:Transcript_76666/g.132622  ORF Transcript_76666/g.132622 Transcript_76666/m.132622 type:complete len:412 (+) Transcript_76666:84-1319(+)